MAKLLSGVIDSIETLLDSIGNGLRSGLHNYCDLETVDDEDTIVAKDGSLMSLIEVKGVRNIVTGKTLFNQIVMPLCSSMRGQFESEAHQMQMWFEVDPDRTHEEISDALRPSRETAKRLNLDLIDLLEERANTISKWTDSERCFIALWTRPGALNKSEKKRDKDDRVARGKSIAFTRNAQDPIRAITLLRNRHKSFVQAMRSEMGSTGIVTEKLDARSALREIRRTMDPGFVSNDWSPALPGDMMYPTRRAQRNSTEEWEILWPPLGWQICSREARIVEANVVEIGERIYSPIYIDLFPRDLKFFMSLFARAKEKNLPWRISFLMEGGGLGSFQFKGLVAQILGMGSSGNKMLARAVNDLKDYEAQGGGVNVKLRVALSTWAPKGDRELLRARASDLARCVESWGSCQVSEVTGDPVAGMVSSALGLSIGSIATKAAAPIEDAMSMMPWSRPSSPWKSGPLLLRSPDGKLMPFEPYSKLQSTWIYLIFAKPGSGKSVLMNMNNLALCLLDGLEAMPRIAIIDVGPSSSGFISLVKEALPANQRYLALHKRLRMVPEHAINPFDTPLGCRYPTAMEMGFLRNLLTLLGTDVTADKAPEGLAGLVSAVIDEMYRVKADKNEPNRYTPGMVPEVDEALVKHHIHLDAKASWWEVEDALFLAGDLHIAHIAHRYAVPMLTDAVLVAQSEKIKNRFGEARVPGTSEPLISAFNRLIGDAIGFFPILSRPTALDLGDARIVALDLDEVARGGGAVGDRVASVMYMLARQVLAKDFYVNKESVQDMPAPDSLDILRTTVPVADYKKFHLARIEEIAKSPKRICYDEFHRTKSAGAVRSQVELDMREGRKFRVDVMLASQILTDFSDDMIELSTGVFIMDGGSEITVKTIEEKFNMNPDTEGLALRNALHAPSAERGGGVFMARFDTNVGKYSLLMTATAGPMEMWALTTTAEDALLRNKLYDRMGPVRARRALARFYPKGTAKADMDQRRQSMREANSNLGDEEFGKNLMDRMLHEIEQKAERLGL
jgi:intracellular multiplication protein IcmB